MRVPIGTSLHNVIDFCGGFTTNLDKVIAGGPMMGTALVTTDVPIIKSYNAILAFQKGTIIDKPDNDCIRCGRCSQVCPMGLMPLSLERAVLREDAEALGELNVMNCMECGSCAFVCPAKRPLVQSMRLGKGILRAKSAKK